MVERQVVNRGGREEQRSVSWRALPAREPRAVPSALTVER